MPLIPIVDKDDNILTYKENSTLDLHDRYRVSALWVTNSRGEILLAQRHKSKKKHPLLWWPAVAGTVEKDETYEENIIKETEEEIGISRIYPILWPKTKTEIEYLHFTQWFTVVIDLPIETFKIQKDEVEAIRWISPENLRNELTESPQNFIPSFSHTASLFF